MIAAATSRDWSRRYPPLAAIALAIILAVFTLPSALNLPQANPGQVAEYAPVPGQNGTSPPGGNVAGLGLGEGGSAEGGAGQATGNGGPGVQVPTNLDCVGNPPRQTEDPLSPPCVPTFSGDNGGNTWVGVTGKEITVVFRFIELQGSCRTGSSYSDNCGAPTGYYDLDNPSSTSGYNAEFFLTFLHYWSVYFNRRYQTYGRHVHFWAYNYGDTQGYVANGYSTNNAASEAADIWSKLRPFADVGNWSVYPDTFTEALAKHNVLTFGYLSQQLASEYPGLYWNYAPSTEYTAQLYASYVCTRVVGPGRTSFSSTFANGTPRKIGLLLTDDALAQDTQDVQKTAVADMKKDCNFTPADTAYFHYSGAFNSSGPNSNWGTGNMAKFKADNITTILWPGGEESEDMQAADNLRYYPEWVLLGDGLLDGNLMSAEPRNEMSHAWVASSITLQNADGIGIEPSCWDAIREVDPGISRSTSDPVYACGGVDGYMYDDIRQLFTGIQLAGPHLTPQAMDLGFHAIPAKPSTSPAEPACYYLPGDYTCVKDGVAEWFDVNAPTPSSDSTGCWRMWENGARFLPGRWPAGDVMSGWSASDICNMAAGGLSTNIRPPGG